MKVAKFKLSAITNFQFTERRREIAVKVIIAFVFIVLGYMLMVQPAFREATVLKEKAETAKERLELASEISRLNRQTVTFEESFSTEAERHLILGKISSAANESGIEVESLVPRSSIVGKYSVLILEVSARTNFRSLINFLEKVEAAKPSLSVTEMNIQNQRSRRSEKEEDSLQVEMVLETFLKAK